MAAITERGNRLPNRNVTTTLTLPNRAVGALEIPMTAPSCIVCSRTPAELALFGRPYCEECAHNLVTDAADMNRRRIAIKREQSTPWPLVMRDGVEGVLVDGDFYPGLAAALGG